MLGLAVLVFSVMALAQGPGKKPQTYTVVKAIRGHFCLDPDPCVPAETVKLFTAWGDPSTGIPYIAPTYVITQGNVVIHAYYDAYYMHNKFGDTNPATKMEGGTHLAPIPVGVPLKMQRDSEGLCWKNDTIFTFCFAVYAEESRGAK
jgi:hypothetical protein